MEDLRLKLDLYFQDKDMYYRNNEEFICDSSWDGTCTVLLTIQRPAWVKFRECANNGMFSS
jgi:hypothetical protein